MPNFDIAPPWALLGDDLADVVWHHLYMQQRGEEHAITHNPYANAAIRLNSDLSPSLIEARMGGFFAWFRPRSLQ